MINPRSLFAGSSLSIKDNTHEAFCSTSDNLSKIREGSYLRVGGRNAFYVINSSSKEKLSWEFDVLDNRCIQISGEVFPKLQRGDSILLTFKQYEMDIVTAIVENGTGYEVGDVLSVETGIPSLDVTSGEYQTTKIIVTNIKEGGVISRIGVKSRGLYIKPPEGESKMVGGSGRGAVFDISFCAFDDALVLERQISSLDFKENLSYVFLDGVLQEGLTGGSLSCEKWKLTLNTLYAGQANKSAYSISRDFTPVLELPLMMQNSFTMDVVYNQAINMLEKEILSLRAEINEIQNHRADHPDASPEQ